jgi:DNA-binding MarR family transcriptional regulator
MDRYTLTYEGRARFKRTRVRMDMEGEEKKEGFEVLDYLYEHGAAAMEEIEKDTGLSYVQIMAELEDLLAWGFVERLAG